MTASGVYTRCPYQRAVDEVVRQPCVLEEGHEGPHRATGRCTAQKDGRRCVLRSPHLGTHIIIGGDK